MMAETTAINNHHNMVPEFLNAIHVTQQAVTSGYYIG